MLTTASLRRGRMGRMSTLLLLSRLGRRDRWVGVVARGGGWRLRGGRGYGVGPEDVGWRSSFDPSRGLWTYHTSFSVCSSLTAVRQVRQGARVPSTHTFSVGPGIVLVLLLLFLLSFVLYVFLRCFSIFRVVFCFVFFLHVCVCSFFFGFADVAVVFCTTCLDCLVIFFFRLLFRLSICCFCPFLVGRCWRRCTRTLSWTVSEWRASSSSDTSRDRESSRESLASTQKWPWR